MFVDTSKRWAHGSSFYGTLPRRGFSPTLPPLHRTGDPSPFDFSDMRTPTHQPQQEVPAQLLLDEDLTVLKANTVFQEAVSMGVDVRGKALRDLLVDPDLDSLNYLQEMLKREKRNRSPGGYFGSQLASKQVKCFDGYMTRFNTNSDHRQDTLSFRIGNGGRQDYYTSIKLTTDEFSPIIVTLLSPIYAEVQPQFSVPPSHLKQPVPDRIRAHTLEHYNMKEAAGAAQLPSPPSTKGSFAHGPFPFDDRKPGDPSPWGYPPLRKGAPENSYICRGSRREDRGRHTPIRTRRRRRWNRRIEALACLGRRISDSIRRQSLCCLPRHAQSSLAAGPASETRHLRETRGRNGRCKYPIC